MGWFYSEMRLRCAVWICEDAARLSLDSETARVWGELTARAQQQGRTVHMADGLIAATALRHGLHVMTRNVSDFEPTGVLLITPC